MKQYYAVIDTNVLVAAHLSQHDDSAVVKVFNKLSNSEIIPLYSNEILKEYKDVLSRKKFSFSSEIISYTLSLIMNKGIQVDLKPSGIKLFDEKDLVFYEIVLEKKDEGAYLITGNKKHFPNDPVIMTASEFLEIIEKENNPT